VVVGRLDIMPTASRGRQPIISVGELRIGGEEKRAISEVLGSGRISEGEKTLQFEQEWATYIGTKYSVALNSGTSALIAGLLALRYHPDIPIEPGSRIITTPLTYIATSNACVLAGFEPVYVDIDEKSFCITPENIVEFLESVDDPSGYSAILPVHLMGYPCDMDAINKIAREHDFRVIEDSAQAHGSIYKNGVRTGSLSDFSAFSFYIAHNVQAGELGAVNTNDIEIFRLIKKIKANGRICDCRVCTRKTTGCPKMKGNNDESDVDPRFTHELIGYNFKTMEFQTVLASVQLKKIDRIIKKRQENVRYLNDGLESVSDVLQLPRFDRRVSYLAYPLVIRDRKKISRKKIRIALEKKGIETRPLFGCIPTQQPAYSHLRQEYRDRLPVAEYVGSNGFYIGCHQYLDQEDLDYVISAFKEIIR